MNRIKVTVVTTCTKKKLATPWAHIPSGMLFDTQEELLADWQAQLKSCPEKRRVPADQLYRGRGFKRLLATVAPAEDILILSAGLGLVKATDNLVPYNLTTSSGSPNHVKNHIAGGFDEGLWWEQICAGGIKLREELPKREGLILIGLSRSYLAMISEDLKALPDDVRSRLRLFGTELEQELAFELFPYVMPYDNRLNINTSPLPGSKVDFSARALQHFYQNILSKDLSGSAADHAKSVFEFISTLGTIEQANKESVDDLEIRRIVDDEWDTCFGRSTRILQTIRKKYGYACSEQRLNRILKERLQDQEEDVGDSE